MSIRLRLLVLVLSALLPAVVAAGWVVSQTYRNEREILQRGLRDTTRALSLVVDRELTSRADIARVLASARMLDNGAALSEAERAAFVRQAHRALGTLAGWVELNAPQGRVLSTRPSSSDRAGAIQSPEPPLLDMPTVRPLYDDGDGAGPRAAVVQPVQRDERTLLNLSLTILPQELQAIIDSQTLPDEAVATILDSRGVVVARHPGGEHFVGVSATPDLLETLTAADEGPFQSASLEGVPTIGYFATSPQGWTYLTALPRQHLASAVPAAVAKMALGASVLLALAVGGALWVSRGIAMPVVALKRLAARMRSGETVEVLPSGIAEIDEVSAAMADASTALRDARADLERQVSEAVASTRGAEQRISQSQRVEALGRLTGGVAHDFNNVLGIISNSAHLMQREAGGDLQAPLAATLRAVEVGSRLTQHLMRFAGRQRVRPQPLDLVRYLNEAHELIQIVLGKRVQLSLWCEPGLPNITVDSSELELALINLALNARDAMPEGGQAGLHARLTDSAEAGGLPAGRYVLVALTDTGVGVDGDSLKHVFEPFFTTKSAGKGTGLGLSQVHGFCQQAGGTARIASVPGVGTTVSMLLPATQAPAVEGTAVPAAADAQAIAGRRLLLVEDNADLGAGTAQLLESYGCAVVREPSAAGALRRMSEDPYFDIVLSDVVMPGEMDGLAMARQLRQARPRLPIVLISGYSAALTEARDFIVLNKPCAPSDLLAALKQAMDGIGAPPQVAGGA